MSIFLDEDDLVKLTGFKHARRQIEQLQSMGIPFRVNAAGLPVVAKVAIEGGRNSAQPQRAKVIPDLLKVS